MLLKGEAWLQLPKTHPLEIPVYHSLAMHVDQASRSVAQLPDDCQQLVRIAEACMGNVRVQIGLHPDVLLQTG